VVIAVVVVLLITVVAFAAYYFGYLDSRQKKKKRGGMQDPLLQNDTLEMSRMPPSSTYRGTSLKCEQHEPTVRKIDSRGMNYPAQRIGAFDAESYGVISTTSNTLDETIPDDSSSDDDAGPDPDDPAALTKNRNGSSSQGLFKVKGGVVQDPSAGVTAVRKELLKTSEALLTTSESLLTTSEFSVPHTGGAVAISSKVCKVLVTGEMRADTTSIQAALVQAEQEIREHYKKDHVTMDITMKPLTVREITSSLDEYLPASELSEYNVVIIAVDARPMYLALFGGGACVDHLLQKFVLFGIPEMSIYFVATRDKGAKEMDFSESPASKDTMTGSMDVESVRAAAAHLGTCHACVLAQIW
jgi:hypothetical protein